MSDEEFEVELLNGEEVTVELPSYYKVQSKLKMAFVELLTDEYEEIEEDNLSMEDAKRIWDVLMDEYGDKL